MKKYFIFINLLVFGFTGYIKAQLKIGYVDSDTIMEKLPDAQDAQQKHLRRVQELLEVPKKVEAEQKEGDDEEEDHRPGHQPVQRREQKDASPCRVPVASQRAPAL